jgi:hypothetical protein
VARRIPKWLVIVAVGGLPVWPSQAHAQIDYRNLDDDRPTLVEDAYPVERYAFEFLAPWRYSRDRFGGTVHAFTPEIEYGLFRNAHLGIKLPIAGASEPGGRDWGISGLRIFALYNFNTETRLLPALSLRSDLTLPVGSLAGEGTRVTVKAIATRSWGVYRLHLNGAYTFGRDRPLAATEGANKWWAGAAVDRTLYRRSMLIIGEVYALRELSADPVELNATLGVRLQLTPYMVFDAGVARRLKTTGPDLELTAGFSRAFALPGLLPTGRPR